MVRVKMLTCDAGPLGCHPPGWTGEVADKEARALIAGGYATAINPPASTETKPPGRKATKPRGETRVKK